MMRNWIKLVEQALEVEQIGMGLKTYQNDEVALSGGMRSGSSPAGYMRCLYVIYDVKAFQEGVPQEECRRGKVEIFEADGGGIRGLVNIEINKSDRRGGWGSRIMRALIDSCPTHFHVSDIKTSAVSFWAAQGCVFFSGKKQLTTAEARKQKFALCGVIPKQGFNEPIENFAKLKP